MKQLFPFSLLVILGASCAKTEFNYAVVCDFPRVGYYQTTLVVSNSEGEVLQHFDLVAGQPQLIQQFNFQARQAEDAYNLHLVRKDTFSNGYNTLEIFSHYGVKNGAAVVFQPEYLYSVYEENIGFYLYVTDVPALDSIDIPGVPINPYYSDSEPPTYHFNYNPVAKTLEIDCARNFDCHRTPRQDLVLRVRSTPSTPFRSLYIPTSGPRVDSVFINWNDLMPETNLQSVSLPNNNYVDGFSIAALSADFQDFVTLEAGKSATAPAFHWPIGLDNASLTRVWLQQGAYINDQIFQPGEPLKVEDANMQITSAALSSASVLAVKTTGAIDLLETVVHFWDDLHYAGNWSVQGEPAALEHAVLPDLSSIVPGWRSPLEFQPILVVSAYQYDRLNYLQLREGLPYKGNAGKLFPEARYGLKKISKTF